MKITELLAEKTECYRGNRNMIINSLLMGVTIFVVLFVARPFGISDDDLTFLFISSAGFGAIVFVTFFINEISIKKYFSKRNGNRWSIPNELLYLAGITFQVSCFNFFYSSLLLRIFSFTFRGYLEIAGYTTILLLPVAFVGILIATLAGYYKKLIVFQTKNEYLVEITRMQQARNNAAETINLFLENEELPFERAKLILVSSLGNYLRIVVESSQGPVEIIKRATLKDMEEQLLPYREFFRCHRSTIVNIKYITTIKGTSKRSKAILCSSGIEVAIARNQIRSLKSMFAAV